MGFPFTSGWVAGSGAIWRGSQTKDGDKKAPG
jgi:hypothetical protein